MTHTFTADKLAHAVIPRHPPLRPHARMIHHFRFILPLLGKDEDDLTPLHYYDSAIQLARHASREPTEQEYVVGMRAAKEIQDTYVDFSVYCFARLLMRWCSLNECLAEMREGSSVDFSICEYLLITGRNEVLRLCRIQMRQIKTVHMDDPARS